MVYDLLIRTRYDSDEKYRVGIERLINNGSYTAAFPLHEVMFFFYLLKLYFFAGEKFF